MEKSRRRRTDFDTALPLGRHVPAKYITGTQLGTSSGRGWKRLLAERWRHAPGQLGNAPGIETEVAVILRGRASFTKWFKRLVGATPGEYRTSYC